MRPASIPIVALLLCLAVACGPPEVEPAKAIGEAFIGPSSIEIRRDLGLRSEVVATLKHGERVDVLQNRRRFTRVRTSRKSEGWIDGRNLLSTAQMGDLQRFRDMGAKLPSQGRATVYDPLNLHTEANRQSPSLAQIPAGGSVEVIAHTVAPRVPFQPAVASIKPTPRPTGKTQGRNKRSRDRPVERIPPPKAPGLPPNWLELSKAPRFEAPLKPKVEAEAEKPKAIAKDDWTLVRTSDGAVGWALTRMLSMAIPDEVARYAEGKRITAYFPLGEVTDDGAVKRHYIWATLSQNLQPYDFDAIRVFVYRLTRHRYETIYQEKELQGHYPMTIGSTTITENRKPLKVPTFSMVVEDENGKLWQRTYSFTLNRVRLASQAPYERPDLKEPTPSLTQTNTPEAVKSWWRRLFR